MNPRAIYRDVGRHIKCYREGANRTQAQLAIEIGISRASLANIEAGRQQVLLHHLYAIANALDLGSPGDLMPVTSLYCANPTDLPLPAKGLSDSQRQEVLNLMSGIVSHGIPQESEID